MLGELPVLEGDVETSGRVSYAPQDPWVFSGTFKENITFGSPCINRERYDAVISACGLVKVSSNII